MILYLDTSALVKRYFNEPHSKDVIEAWKLSTQIVTSSAAYAETMACIQRKRRETGGGLKPFQKITNAFHRDWLSFIRVEVTDELNGHIDRLMKNHPLRGFDAIHLASALVVYERVPEAFLFCCFDNQLLLAASKEGLETLPDLSA